MRPRQDLADNKSPGNIEVFQLTHGEIPACHLYMEAQVFTPDSKKILLHQGSGPHFESLEKQADVRQPLTLAARTVMARASANPDHKYFICDMEDNCSLHPVIDELGAKAPSVSPTGPFIYYFVEMTDGGGKPIYLKRVPINGGRPETVMVLGARIPGTPFTPRFLYALSTMSSDGRNIAISAILENNAPGKPVFGLLVFDLEKAEMRLVLEGENFCNMHPQYSRSHDPAAKHGIMIQENHGCIVEKSGPSGRKIVALTGAGGADIHLVSDDGAQLRSFPWGRDNIEECQGHQCWRGGSAWAITSTSIIVAADRDNEAQLIESSAVRADPEFRHAGRQIEGGVRNELSRSFPAPRFYHFATDAAGETLVTDCGGTSRMSLWLAKLGKPGVEAGREWTYLLSPDCPCPSLGHMHPFLSPNGRHVFFNSIESGNLQAYMIKIG